MELLWNRGFLENNLQGLKQSTVDCFYINKHINNQNYIYFSTDIHREGGIYVQWLCGNKKLEAKISYTDGCKLDLYRLGCRLASYEIYFVHRNGLRLYLEDEAFDALADE